MGGSAFDVPKPGEPALSICRLSNSIYDSLQQEHTCLLSNFFARVTVPQSAPGKTSHGDLDVLVCDAKYQFSVEHIAAKLGARSWIHVARNPTTNFAIPLRKLLLPARVDTTPAIRDNAQCFQLDVHVCPSEIFDWEVFHKAYGDLWNLLGTSIRPFGLTANDNGLHLRIHQIEKDDRKKSLLLLTRLPKETLAFLGLDQEEFERGFESVEELFEYAAGGRFFRRGSYFKDELKSNDRQRLKQREIYRRFVEEYLPTHPELGIEAVDKGTHSDDGRQSAGDGTISRASVLDEALDTFNVRSRYDTMIAEWETKQQEAQMWRKVAAVVPLEGDKLNLVIRGLKRWVTSNSEGELYLRDKPILDGTGGLPMLKAEDGGEEKLLDWVSNNWGVVKEKEKKRVGDAKQQRKALCKK